MDDAKCKTKQFVNSKILTFNFCGFYNNVSGCQLQRVVIQFINFLFVQIEHAKPKFDKACFVPR